MHVSFAQPATAAATLADVAAAGAAATVTAAATTTAAIAADIGSQIRPALVIILIHTVNFPGQGSNSRYMTRGYTYVCPSSLSRS